MPSCGRLVATATSGSPERLAAYFATSIVRPPPMPDQRVVEARRAGRRAARRRPGPSRPRRAQISRVRELRAQRRGDLLAEPGPDDHRNVAATGDPAVGEQRRQAGDRARARCRSSAACRPGGSAAARDLPRPGEVDVVVDLYPLDRTDRSDAHAPAAVGELLEAVLVVQRRIAPPGRLERVRERPAAAARSASRRCTRPARSPGPAPC